MTKRAAKQPAKLSPHLCEVTVAEGLEDVARTELLAVAGSDVRLPRSPAGHPTSGALRFHYTGELRGLLYLHTVLAAFLVRQFDIPRPRALLGDEHFRILLKDIERARRLHSPDAFQTFYLGAAGSESGVMARLKEIIARQTGLRAAEEEGDLLLRIRPVPGSDSGWEVLTRLSPRPLATRPWRVCNMEGALNATVAHAMALLTDPRPEDVFVNLACGSGTLLIERLACAPARQVIGCDTNPEALACARQNVAAAGFAKRVRLETWDARSLPLPDASADALCADLPFGHLVGTHEENTALYPAILTEAARIARQGAPFVVITHEVRLMESLLATSPHWQSAAVLRVTLGGLYPRIFILQRM